MRTREVEKYLRQYLVPHLDGFEVHERLLYKQPRKPFISGFFFDEPSYDSAILYIRVFVQPTFIPAEFFYFSFGNELGRLSGGGRKRWKIEAGFEEDSFQEILQFIDQEGIPFLDSQDSPGKFIEFYKKKATHPHVIIMEAFVYSLLLEGFSDEAEDKLTAMLQSIDKLIEKSPYLVEQRNRANTILDLMQKSSDIAINQLETWSNETLENLGLE